MKIALVTTIFLLIPTILLGQNDMIQLERGSWVLSLAGNLYFRGLETGTAGQTTADIANTHFTVSTRSGMFVADRLLFGLDWEYSRNGSRTKPDPNPNNQESLETITIDFIGMFTRYYVPISSRLTIAPEFVAAVGMYTSEKEFKSDIAGSSKAVETTFGFGGSVGACLCYLVNQYAAVDVTVRYGLATLSGEDKGGPKVIGELETAFSNIDVLFGFQVYLY